MFAVIKRPKLMRTLTTLAIGCGSLLTQAQSINLDPLFGTNGAVLVQPSVGANEANAHAFSTDGKLLIVGDGYFSGFNNFYVSLVRMDTVCGALDTTFGNGGMIAHLHQGRTRCYDIAMQPDGKIIGAGQIAPDNSWSQHKAGVFRFNADGSVDSTFNGFGYQLGLWDPTSSGLFVRAFVNADSTITCAGQSYGNINGGQATMGAMRFTYDGQLDTSFSNDGIVTIPLSTDNGTAAMRPDGRSVVIGARSPDHVIIMAQFNTDGSLDTTFGTMGISTTPVISYAPAWDRPGAFGATILADGRLLFSGPSLDASGGLLMARFLEDGTLDTSYGTNGVSVAAMPGGSIGYDHELLPDGGSLQFGRSGDAQAITQNGICVKRDADGQVVTSFGTDGFAIANTTPVDVEGFIGGGVLGNGRIVGYGYRHPGYLMACLLTDEPVNEALPVISIDDATLTTTGNGAFQWFLDGQVIPGATGSTYEPTQNGTYTVTMTVSAECSYTSAPFTLLNVGLSEMSGTQLRLLDNPVAETLVVQNDGAAAPYELLTIAGQRVAGGTLRSGRNDIGLSGLASGVYLLHTNTAQGIRTHRIVKQ